MTERLLAGIRGRSVWNKVIRVPLCTEEKPGKHRGMFFGKCEASSGGSGSRMKNADGRGHLLLSDEAPPQTDQCAGDPRVCLRLTRACCESAGFASLSQ